MNWKLALIGTLSVVIAPAMPLRSGTARNPNPPSDPPAVGRAPAKVAAGDQQVAPPPRLRLPELKFYPKTTPVPAIMSRTEYMWEYTGQVTAVDEFSITIRAWGEEPKRFPAAGKLAGQQPIEPEQGSGYVLSDVRVGDLVSIRYYTSHRRGILEVCLEVKIWRRPGGKIPPWPGDGDPLTNERGTRFHQRMQAYQDWEEKGIPIPEKFRPVPTGMLAVPFPPEAPMPRPAGPRPKA
jgi:hypothetical protein